MGKIIILIFALLYSSRFICQLVINYTNASKCKIVTICHYIVLEYLNLVRDTELLGCLILHQSTSEILSLLEAKPKTSMWGSQLHIWPGYLMVSHVIVWNPSPRCPLTHRVSRGLVFRSCVAIFVIKVRKLLPPWEKVFSDCI